MTTTESTCSQLSSNHNSNNTIIGLLRERMEVGRLRTGELSNNIPTSRSSQLKQRFRLKSYLVGCFFKDHNNTTPNDHFQPLDHDHMHEQDIVVPDNDHPTAGMNVALALAAERQMMVTETESPGRVSLMRLLEETESEEEAEDYCCNKEEEGEGGDGVLCCVCMGRKKGAALIPCGHTFCRVCPREVWLNRGTCPLCNRSILDILDIF